VKLKHLDEDIALRRAVARYYLEHITNPEVQLPTIKDWDAHVFHLFPVLCKRRDELQRYLTENGIQTNIHYPIPPHKQKCYAEYGHLALPLTEQIHAEELSLPMSPVLELDEMEYVVKILNDWK